MFLEADDGLINVAHVARIEFNERAGDGEGGRRGDYPSVEEARAYVREVIG